MINQGLINAQVINAGVALGGAELVTIPSGYNWALRVLLDGQDVTDRITGDVSVDAEEGAARVCQLSLMSEAGPVSAASLLGKSLAVTHLQDGQEVTAFNGTVAEPVFNRQTGLIQITGSDNLQQKVEAQDVATLDALIGGYWSQDVYGEIESHWEYAQDRLLSVPASLELDTAGNLRLVPWAASAARWRVDDVLYGSLDVRLASTTELINKVVIEAAYRYSRLRHREHVFSWEHPAGSFCAWRLDDTELPTVSMVRDVFEGAGWNVINLSYEALPESAPNICGDQIPWINYYTADPLLLDLVARVSNRAAQPIGELYSLTVTHAGSVSANGELIRRERYSAEAEYEARVFEEADDQTRPAGATQDSLGDWIEDRDDAGQREALLLTALHAGRTAIAASHRKSEVKFDLPTTARAFDLTDAIELDAAGVKASGKLRRIEWRWSLNEGSAITTLTMAISQGYAGTATPLLPPNKPVPAVPNPPVVSSALPTQLAGRGAVYDETQDGFAGNYTNFTSGGDRFPRRFAATMPDFAGEHRDQHDEAVAAAYTVTTPTDLLEVTV